MSDFILAGLVLVAFILGFYLRSRQGIQEKSRLRSELNTLTGEKEQLLTLQKETEKQYVVAEQRRKDSESTLAIRTDEYKALFRERDSLLLEGKEKEKTVALVEQRLAEMQTRMENWEKVREEMIQSARSSLLSAGNEMATNLLAINKSERAEEKKQHEEVVKKNTDAFIEQFKNITESVTLLKGQREQDAQLLTTVWRSLSTPAGAGQLAEVGLENALKNLGLQPGRDFIMQYTIPGHEDGSQLRPDCLVFLTQGQVMVIDSKASKFVLELAQAENNVGQHAETLASFARSMNAHLKALATKDYEGAVRQMYRLSGRADEISHIHSIMYVPNDNAYAHIGEADPDFVNKAQQKRLILASPVLLSGLLSFAMTQIIQARQAANQKEINEAVQSLLDGMVSMFSHIQNVGDGIKDAAQAFSAFASSANRFVLPRARKLHALGVHHTKQDKLPSRIKDYTVSSNDSTVTLEAEEISSSFPMRVLEKPELA